MIQTVDFHVMEIDDDAEELLWRLCMRLERKFASEFKEEQMPNLILTRRKSESIVIADNIVVTVTQIGRGRVSLSIEADPSVRIMRKEAEEKRAT